MQLVWLATAAGIMAACLAGCERPARAVPRPTIATTTSYLEAAVGDLLQTQPVVLRLSEPGTCPGHFDVRPSEVQKLRSCRVLLRFDFQKSLDSKLGFTRANAVRVCDIMAKGGMCVPETYFSACEQVAKHLTDVGILDGSIAESRLKAIKARLETLSAQVSNLVATAQLVGMPVIASHHQSDFCAWLGLKVVATFRGADTAGIREIDDAVKAGKIARVRLVIANSPEGTRTADSLAANLGAKMIVFDNFPSAKNGVVSFDEMIMANVRKLVACARQ